MIIKSLLFSGALLATTFPLAAHGPGRVHREEERAAMTETVDIQETGVPTDPTANNKPWGVNFETGWESRHVHYGVNETGSSGAYASEIGVRFGDFSANVWNGFGLGNSFLEWDFTAAYNFEIGPVFVVPGYNFRYMPGHAASEPGEHGHEDEHGHAEENANHAHGLYGHELFVALGTTAIPHVTPAANLIWDLNNLPGLFAELRLDGDIPIVGDFLSFEPYALLGLNFGYNTTAVYGLNNFQFGLQASCRICAWASIFAGANYSVALNALEAIDQDNIFWLNIGLSFAY